MKRDRDAAIDAAYEGVMITYTERDFPTATPYQRTVPGWRCRAYGRQYGTSGLPPRRCDCGATWAEDGGSDG